MSASRRKGTAFESAVVAYLIEHGFPYAERRALRGVDDRGDIAGIPGVVMELKACKDIRLAEFVDEAKAEGRNAAARLAVAVVKRRRKGTGDAYVVMDLAQFCALLTDDTNT